MALPACAVAPRLADCAHATGKWQTVSTLPDKHDSVLGEAGQGLNYDEIVVYRNDAMLPRYLVYYKL